MDPRWKGKIFSRTCTLRRLSLIIETKVASLTVSGLLFLWPFGSFERGSHNWAEADRNIEGKKALSAKGNLKVSPSEYSSPQQTPCLTGFAKWEPWKFCFLVAKSQLSRDMASSGKKTFTGSPLTGWKMVDSGPQSRQFCESIFNTLFFGFWFRAKLAVLSGWAHLGNQSVVALSLDQEHQRSNHRHSVCILDLCIFFLACFEFVWVCN